MDRFYDKIKHKISGFEKDAKPSMDSVPDFEWDRIDTKPSPKIAWNRTGLYIAASVVLTSLFWIGILMNQDQIPSSISGAKSEDKENSMEHVQAQNSTKEEELGQGILKGQIVETTYFKSFEGENENKLIITTKSGLNKSKIASSTRKQATIEVDNSTIKNKYEVLPLGDVESNADVASTMDSKEDPVVDPNTEKSIANNSKEGNDVENTKLEEIVTNTSTTLSENDSKLAEKERLSPPLTYLDMRIHPLESYVTPNIDLTIEPYIRPLKNPTDIKHSIQVFSGYSVNAFNSTYTPIKPDSKSFTQKMKGDNYLYGASYAFQKINGFGMEVGIEIEKMSFLIEKNASFKINKFNINKFDDREEISNEVIVSSGLSFRAVSTTVVAPKDGELSSTDSLSYVLSFKSNFSKVAIPILINYSLPVGRKGQLTVMGGPEFQIVKEVGLEKFAASKFDHKGKRFEKFLDKKNAYNNATINSMKNRFNSVNVKLGVGYEYALSNTFSLFSDVNFSKNIKNINSADNFKINLSNIDIRIGSKFFL